MGSLALEEPIYDGRCETLLLGEGERRRTTVVEGNGPSGEHVIETILIEHLDAAVLHGADNIYGCGDALHDFHGLRTFIIRSVHLANQFARGVGLYGVVTYSHDNRAGHIGNGRITLYRIAIGIKHGNGEVSNLGNGTCNIGTGLLYSHVECHDTLAVLATLTVLKIFAHTGAKTCYGDYSKKECIFDFHNLDIFLWV